MFSALVVLNLFGAHLILETIHLSVCWSYLNGLKPKYIPNQQGGISLLPGWEQLLGFWGQPVCEGLFCWKSLASGTSGCPLWPRGCPGGRRMWLQVYPSQRPLRVSWGERAAVLPPTPWPVQSQLPLCGAATCTALGCSAPHTGQCLELSESSVSLCTHADKNLGGLAKMYVLAHTPAPDQDKKYQRDLKVRCTVSALS